MTDAKRMILWMSLFLAAVAALCIALFAPIASAFAANQVFNGLILAVLAVGIVVNFTQVLRLRPAAEWIDEAERGVPPAEPAPRLLAPMARIFASRAEDERLRLSMTVMRSLLDGVRLRLDESREVSRYMIGMLIFLGLLGTFWGLLETVGGVGRVIGGLSNGGGDAGAVFEGLKRDLAGPLAGMGTAFSSSLFGLGGALVLGVLDLQAGHAQNRFYNRLEEWLSGSTHLPSGKLALDGDQLPPRYVEALLERTAENVDQLQRTMARNEEERFAAQANLARLADQIAALTDQLRAEQKLLVGLAKDQTDLQPAIADLARQIGEALGGYEGMREHLRGADVSLQRLVTEVATARQQLPDELRREIRLLAQSLARRTPHEV
jgi:hypothetical protein